MTLGIGAGALVGAAGAVAGGAIAANGAKSAAGAQGQSATNALYNQMLMEVQSHNDTLPYIQTGSWAQGKFQQGLQDGTFGGKFTGQDYLNNADPGYGFQLNQGQQALQNSQAAGSGVLSGAALKGLIGYNQGMASTGYQNAYNRWLSTQGQNYGQLSGLMSLGENAAVGSGNAGVGYANGASSAAQNIGNARAAGDVGSANALSSGISNGAGYYALNNMLGGNKSSGGQVSLADQAAAQPIFDAAAAA